MLPRVIGNLKGNLHRNVRNALTQVKAFHLDGNNDYLEKEIKILQYNTKVLNDINHKIDELTLKIKLNNIEDSKKIDELTFAVKQIKEGKLVSFLNVKNKWKYVGKLWPCCKNECVNTNNPTGFCIKGNGFFQIKNDTSVEYFNCRGDNGINKLANIMASTEFNPKEYSTQHYLNFLTYSLFYYEVKFQFKENAEIWIGLYKNMDCILLNATSKFFYYIDHDKKIKLPTFSIKNGDVLGCGIVYPPPKNNNKLPYIFFTQKGKQIGKAILFKENYEYLRPEIYVKCCSAETNFGNDLSSKPFIYDISKHYVAEEFYKDEEYSKFEKPDSDQK